MTFAGLRLRAAALLSPLLLVTACTTQNALNDGMSMQPRTSYADASPSVETTSEEVTTGTVASASPEMTEVLPSGQGGEIPVPSYARSNAASGESGQKLVQVASLAPAAPRAQEAEAVVEYDEAIVAPSKVRPVRATSRDHECLARAMYFESNRSSREGMVAVGSVVMNRVEDGRWGNSVCSVVGAPRQFAPGVLSKSMDYRGGDLAMEAAASVLKGERHPRVYKEVMFFHTAGYRFKYNNMHYVAVAGGNSFYEKRRRMRGQRNTPQHVVMAQGGSRIERLAQPVKTAFSAPVKAARSLFGSDERPQPKRTAARAPQPLEVVEAPAVVETEAPAVQVAPKPVKRADAGYMKTPGGGFVTVAGSKGGRVVKTQPASINR